MSQNISGDLVRKLRTETGEGLMNCYYALVVSESDYEVAREYLRLRSQALSRKKRNQEGEIVPWNTEDYLIEARKEAKKRP